MVERGENVDADVGHSSQQYLSYRGDGGSNQNGPNERLECKSARPRPLVAVQDRLRNKSTCFRSSNVFRHAIKCRKTFASSSHGGINTPQSSTTHSGCYKVLVLLVVRQLNFFIRATCTIRPR